MNTRTTTPSRMSRSRSPLRMKRIAHTVASAVLCALATSCSSAQAQTGQDDAIQEVIQGYA